MKCIGGLKNFLGPFEKKFSENFEKMKLKMRLEYSDKTSFFEVKLFSNASRKFSVDFTDMFKVSERSA